MGSEPNPNPTPLITNLMSALTPEVAADMASYEQSSILNATNPDYGNPD